MQNKRQQLEVQLQMFILGGPPGSASLPVEFKTQPVRSSGVTSTDSNIRGLCQVTVHREEVNPGSMEGVHDHQDQISKDSSQSNSNTNPDASMKSSAGPAVTGISRAALDEIEKFEKFMADYWRRQELKKC